MMGEDGLSLPTIYHGTPLTPRAALLAVLLGRAACVSFYRPDDMEAVEGICPDIMFRPRRIFVLDVGDAGRSRVGPRKTRRMVARLLCMARAAAIPSGTLGRDSGQPKRPFPTQRRPTERLAFWPEQGRSCLSYEWPNRAPRASLRTIRPCLSRLDRPSQARAGRMRCLSPEDGRNRSILWKPLASNTSAAGGCRGSQISRYRSGRDHVSAKRAPLRLAGSAPTPAFHLRRVTSPRALVRSQCLCRQIGASA